MESPTDISVKCLSTGVFDCSAAFCLCSVPFCLFPSAQHLSPWLLGCGCLTAHIPDLFFLIFFVTFPFPLLFPLPPEAVAALDAWQCPRLG